MSHLLGDRIVFGRFTPEDLARAVAHLKGEAGVAGNPCVAVYGPGPEGAKCAACEHFVPSHDVQKGAVHKWVNASCDWRPPHSSFHQYDWPACRLYRGPEPEPTQPAQGEMEVTPDGQS